MSQENAHPSLQPDHGYVLLVVLAAFIVNGWASLNVVSARAKFGVEYPQMYVEKDEPHFNAFNCVQRAHQNMLEHLSLHLMTLLASSLYRPKLAAIAGVVRLLGFVAYIHGYSSGDPQKRLRGVFGFWGYFAAIGLTVEAALRLLGVA
ncbi:TPA: hypothetical protein N0F65_001447 [Lagenidium giganteum]|uniref:Glutathione S-transferase 3, mitochondrial n=1 Tax=Lagenidium giganteum TaxID=4803 RepID=A0AAV2Z1Y7_9STRA|nr:TPA: hypothetical protein N0F65_001447 [Lagenidium giganteum]